METILIILGCYFIPVSILILVNVFLSWNNIETIRDILFPTRSELAIDMLFIWTPVINIIYAAGYLCIILVFLLFDVLNASKIGILINKFLDIKIKKQK